MKRTLHTLLVLSALALIVGCGREQQPVAVVQPTPEIIYITPAPVEYATPAPLQIIRTHTPTPAPPAAQPVAPTPAAAAPPASKSYVTVITWAGTRYQASERFQLAGGQQRVTVDASDAPGDTCEDLSLYLKQPDGRSDKVSATTGRSQSYWHARAGTYHLEVISSFCSYSVQLEEER